LAGFVDFDDAALGVFQHRAALGQLGGFVHALGFDDGVAGSRRVLKSETASLVTALAPSLKGLPPSPACRELAEPGPQAAFTSSIGMSPMSPPL